jgi:glycosyltransferase involved in cell wall biosynthesis
MRRQVTAPSATAVTGNDAPLSMPCSGTIHKLNIVIVCDHAHISGGLAKVALTSATALGRCGHRVIVFAAVGPVSNWLRSEGVEVICLDQPDILDDSNRVRAAMRALWNGVAARELRRLLETLDRTCSIVHVHGWSKALSPSIIWASGLSGIPVVHTLHEYSDFCPNGTFFNFVTRRNCSLRPMSLSCIASNCDSRNYAHKLWRAARHAALANAGRIVENPHFIYLCDGQRAIVEPHLPPAAQLHLVPNPVDADDCGPSPVRDNEAFVFIGRLSTEKGATLLADAAVREGFPALFIGDGPIRDEIANIAPAAKITGWLDTDPMRQRLRCARALVFPSIWYETFGLSVYEAMANGIPVIASDNTVSASAVEPGTTGLLFKSGDVDDLIRCLRTLCDPEIAHRMGLAAYQRYWANPLTLSRHTERLEQLYQRIIWETSTGRGADNCAAKPRTSPRERSSACRKPEMP